MLSYLPHVTATLNALVLVLITAGWLAIKRGDRIKHPKMMVSAGLIGVGFVASYGLQTWLTGHQRFPGDDLDRTPRRVGRAWVEDLVGGYATPAEELLTWTSAPAGAGPVVVRQVSYASVCAHHLLPFHGHADVAYLPGERQAGLSKIARVIDDPTLNRADTVASGTLKALGKQPLVVPDTKNRMASILLGKLIPRAAAIRLVGRNMRNMYRPP